MRINEVVDTFGISSRTLRYYEEMGLLWSSHPDNKSQRYYDADALERLKQIIILRKLQIPVKNIVNIFKSESTASLIQAFVDKLESLDTEITALSELRRLVDDFLHKMLMNGIKKISAITLLYEETEKRLATAQKEEEITFERLQKTSREALRLHDVRIIRLPPMRFLTSRLNTGQAASLDGGNMQSLFSGYGLVPNPGLRDCFYRKEPNDEWIMLMQIHADFNNTTDYTVELFPGGLFAVASSFMEDLDDTFVLLRNWVRASDFCDYDSGEDKGALRHEMIEEILPWDIAEKTRRYQQDVFIPIKIRQENQNSEPHELAKCGCRCDLCKAYAPNVEKNDQRETLAKMWNKYYGLDPSVMDSCGGCKNNPSDTDCPVRKCVLEKKLNHCGDCGDFPCGIFYKRCGSFPAEKKKDFDMDEYNEYILAYDNETRLKEYKVKQERLKKVSVNCGDCENT